MTIFDKEIRWRSLLSNENNYFKKINKKYYNYSKKKKIKKRINIMC